MSAKRPKVLVVVGPTASGKTALAIALAKRFDGEVISADSRQVYKKLDIGTAKVTREEMDGVPHHLIDVVDIDSVYTANDFKRDASLTITDITKRGKLPIIAGGTFFYLDTLLERITAPAVAPNPELRKALEAKSTEELAAQLEQKDPQRYLTIDRKNRRRLIRALEIVHELEYVPAPRSNKSPYDTCIIGIAVNHDKLREKFTDRAKEWLKTGFKEEVESLLEQGVSRERLKEIGFEYTLMLELIDGEVTEEEFIEKFVQKNWQYAKRQMTWLKRDKSIRWFEKDDPEIFEVVEGFLE